MQNVVIGIIAWFCVCVVAMLPGVAAAQVKFMRCLLATLEIFYQKA
ncbi:MFS transporter [Mobiluncus mulieris]|nr:MFS transporter [Mobiluncus mulieris]NMW91494.1 MFS transporter [Mobiluncus mulieris]